MSEWNVVWSKYLHRKVSAIGFSKGCVIISAESTLYAINREGEEIWSHNLSSSPYEIGASEHEIIILYGRGFQLLNPHDGTPLLDGRTVESGFSKCSFRPGGGVLLSDRGGDLHLFDANATGIKKINEVSTRNIVGWLDRECVIIHNFDGHLITVNISDEKRVSKIGSDTWSWSSNLKNGKLICQSTDGVIWEGVPNKFGWDYHEKTDLSQLEPISALLIDDSWYILTFSNELIVLNSKKQTTKMISGEFICSDDNNHIVTCSREGLLRWWETSQTIRDRNESLYKAVEVQKKELNLKQRKMIFESASAAEDSNIDEAIRLYRVIGREADVQRLERMKSGGVFD